MAKKREGEQEIIIDWRHLLIALLKKSWLILLTGVLCAIMMIAYTMFFVTPKYASSVMLYVNNKSLHLGNVDFSISASDLSASQSLIDTYIVILRNRTTMEEVAEEAGVDYHYSKLLGMISTSKVEGTEVFKVTVTSEDPHEAAHIANCIANILPARIADIIDGSSMKVVDSAIVNSSKVSPDITGEGIKAFAIGCVVMTLIVAFFAIIDDTIRSEDYVTQTYDLPILAVIPDFDNKGRSGYYKRGYYYKRSYYKSYGYGQKQKEERKG
ncbi:MAG: hypothetical protein J6Q68_03255 [Clostridia bacterium]|nr:hypothetical protein [Clostridia bacterium]